MLVIRELKKEEIKKARDLYYECFKRNKQNDYLITLGTIIGAFLEDELIGIAQIDYINNNFENLRIGYINSFCIKEEYRNKGYGTELLEKCIETIKLNGGNLINLTSNKNRVYAHLLYKKLGFVEVDTVLLKKEI